MIERYWSQMFGKYEVSPGKFEIPGFPEPLMSAHFGKRNRVGEKQPEATLSFFLCEFLSPPPSQTFSRIQFEDLAQAIARSEFWEFQESQGPETAPFMKRLLPFLVEHGGVYTHYFLEQEGELVASAIVGQTNESALVFNGLVAQKHRSRGYAREIFLAIRQRLSGLGVFFWTKHPYLKLGADRIYPYELI